LATAEEEYCCPYPVTTGREEVGSEASTRVRRAVAAAIATGSLLLGAAVAVADPGQPAPPPPPPSTGGGGQTSSGTTTTTQPTSTDSKPPPRVRDLRVSTTKPGEIALTWTLVHPSDVAHVFVVRGPAGACPKQPLQPGATRVGSLDRRSSQIDKHEHDTTRYCYAVFALDAAGNWASPATHLARNKGDTVPPAPVTAVAAVVGSGGAIHVTWTNPPDAAHDLVVRGPGSTCPHFAADGEQIGTRRARESQVDSSVPGTGTYCYAVFAYDAAGNASPLTSTTFTPASAPITSPTSSGAAPPPSQPASSGSSLPDAVGIVGGGAIVLAGLAYAALRLARREWEWHSRTGYGIRDLMSIDVRDYDRTALVIPAIIGVCIAGALVVLLLSL
jgi:hypothetical protein